LTGSFSFRNLVLKNGAPFCLWGKNKEEKPPRKRKEILLRRNKKRAWPQNGRDPQFKAALSFGKRKCCHPKENQIRGLKKFWAGPLFLISDYLAI
jgi:hypothetical protein